ncbi:conserved Plasmodium protein, unknown function [Plasmodium gallinaceum]|uniref:Uncharacterized protein n=1 Tax=Plasmodium gallinaceum TaxID=5849 RepID=A0A1J1GL41_PLAGA|nr:conserved Plasmodium protein, unknown function [Plasmodium gallinaceum]CRG93118.1 conserved Plasmodium protein, unknown function [Plasmodium gallinaceum]
MVEIRLKTKNSSCEFNLDFSEVKIPDDINILKDLEKEIENSIYHLKRSNEEIKEFDPLGKDNDLFLALNENKFALSRKEERLQLIKKKIHNLESLNLLNEVSVCNDPLTNKDKKLEIGILNENDNSKDENNDSSIKNILSDNLNDENLYYDNSNQNYLCNKNLSGTIKDESETHSEKNTNALDENGIYL